MKFAISKFEQLAITSHLVGLPCPNPEYGLKRLRAWDELGVSDLADTLATVATVGGVGPPVADWTDKTASVVIDINPDILDHVIAALGGQVAGLWADTLTRLRGRLERLRDKDYALPQQLR